MSDFYERYIYLCARRGKSPSAVANEIGLSSAAATGWKQGKDPSEVTLAKLAQFFDVSVSYLKNEPEKKKTPTAQVGSEVDEVTRRLLDIVLNGTAQDRQDLWDVYQVFKRREQR